MLTLFATGRSFVGHSRIIQRNVLKSWKLLHPDLVVCDAPAKGLNALLE